MTEITQESSYMKPHLAFSLVLLSSFAPVPGLAIHLAQATVSSSSVDTALQAELLKMGEEDQRERAKIHELMKVETASAKEELAELWKKQEEIDKRNMRRLEEIIKQHGWPGKSLVGEDGARVAFLILQHADSAMLEKYFPLLKEAAAKGEASPAHAAMMEDRILTNQGKKQIYGTQLHTVEGKLELYPIEDEENVDARRAAVGLPPLSEYVKHFGLEYKPPKK
jgi:hypothetical protein